MTTTTTLRMQKTRNKICPLSNVAGKKIGNQVFINKTKKPNKTELLYIVLNRKLGEHQFREIPRSKTYDQKTALARCGPKVLSPTKFSLSPKGPFFLFCRRKVPSPTK